MKINAPPRMATAALIALCTLGPAAAQPRTTDWAFPRLDAPAKAAAAVPPKSVGLAGSTVRYSPAALGDRFHAVDWRPSSHPPMPAAVRDGHAPDVAACGFCHLPGGQGRPENAALAGLPAAYIVQQVADFRSGARGGVHPDWAPTALMIKSASGADPAAVADAAAYFSKLTFTSRVKVVEAAMLPEPTAAAGVYKFGPGRAALGQRIIEGPTDFDRFEKRDDRVGFVAYVPVGAIARGRALAASGDGGRTQPCAACHGETLRGGLGPPLAGRSPTYLFRQLLGFRSGARGGADSLPMQAVTAKLDEADMIDLAAYAASLRP